MTMGAEILHRTRSHLLCVQFDKAGLVSNKPCCSLSAPSYTSPATFVFVVATGLRFNNVWCLLSFPYTP